MQKPNINSRSSLSHMDIAICSVTGFLLLTTILSGIILSSSTTHADNSSTDSVSVTVESACTLSATGGGTYSGSVTPGSYTTITGSTLSTVCNDPNGYSLYAIGYGNDSYDAPTNTQMIGAGGIGNISTGTAKSGNTSNWAMQVTPTTGSAPTIMNGFDSANFHVVPDTYTQVAKYTASTASTSATGASVNTNYQVYASSTQAAGSYTGKVKYTMVHPSTAPAPTPTYAMQNLATSKCTTTPTTVVDNRDGEEYTIQRLADGECWMLDNLRLGDTSTINLTPADTNIASNWTLPASTTTGFTDDTTGYTQPAVNADYKNTTTTSYGAGSGKIGNYYNFCAASAGTYCYASGSSTGDASQDICPKGWRMPTGGPSGEYKALYTAYSRDADNFRNALSTTLSGHFYNGSASGQGSGGLFWSSTRNDGDRMTLFYVLSGYLTMAYNDYRYYGYSMRCLLGS